MQARAHIALVGPTGAGKTTVGADLAGRLGLPFLDLDREIERASGASVAGLFAREGEAGFRERESQALARALAGAPAVIATGAGVVLDERNRLLLRAHCVVVQLDLDVAGQRARLAGGAQRPLLQGADPDAILAEMARTRGPLYAGVADLAIDTRGIDAAQVATLLAARLRDAPRAGACA